MTQAILMINAALIFANASLPQLGLDNNVQSYIAFGIGMALSALSVVIPKVSELTRRYLGLQRRG